MRPQDGVPAGAILSDCLGVSSNLRVLVSDDRA